MTSRSRRQHPRLRRTSSGSPSATTKARCRRSAPAAATTRSPRPSSAPSTSSTRRRTWWRSSPASAARRRRRPTSSGARTASTPRMGACRRSRPAPPRPTASSPTSASRATAIRSRSASGSWCHAIRRNVDMLYVIENNGVYGLTKGQFSASADVGTKSKRGEANQYSPIDPVLLALTLGATLRGAQLLRRQGAARPDPEGGALAQGLRAHRRHLPLRDLQRPRGLDQELPQHAQEHAADHLGRLRAAAAAEITTEYAPGSPSASSCTTAARCGCASWPRTTTPATARRPPTRSSATAPRARSPPGLFFVDTKSRDMHDISGTTDVPLSQLPFEKLCPGSAALDELQKSFR